MTDIVKTNEMAMEFLSKAKADLAKTSTMDEVKGYRERAEALRVFYQHSKKGIEFQNFYAEVRIRAERRGGEILRDMRANNELEGQGGDRKSKCPKGILNLAKIGITPKESSRFKKIAEIPEKEFEEKINEVKDQRQELTSSKFISLHQRIVRESLEKKTDESPEFTAYLLRVTRKADSFNNQIDKLKARIDDLGSEAIWESPERYEICRAIGLVVENGQILLKELEAVEKSKTKKTKKADVTEMASEATLS